MAHLFDLDGTLLDHAYAKGVGARHLYMMFSDVIGPPEDMFVEQWCDLPERLWVPFISAEQITAYRRARVRAAFDDQGIDDEEADRRHLIYADGYASGWRLFPDVLPCLERLDSPIGIVTNGPQETQTRKLRETGVYDFFAPYGAIVISEAVRMVKPAAEIFHLGCTMLGMDPRNVAYVGDSLKTDAEAAENAGLRGIWLNRKSQDKNPRILTIHSLDELPTDGHSEGA